MTFNLAICFFNPILWAYLSGWLVASNYPLWAIFALVVAVVAQARLAAIRALKDKP